MGYPFGSTEFRLPNLLRHLISSLVHPLALSHYLLDPPTPSPARPDSLPDPDTRSQDPRLLLLPVMKFSDLEEDHHAPPPEDCAVCLCAFASGDEVRRLANCRHFFHRSCLSTRGWTKNYSFLFLEHVVSRAHYLQLHVLVDPGLALFAGLHLYPTRGLYSPMATGLWIGNVAESTALHLLRRRCSAASPVPCKRRVAN